MRKKNPSKINKIGKKLAVITAVGCTLLAALFLNLAGGGGQFLSSQKKDYPSGSIPGQVSIGELTLNGNGTANADGKVFSGNNLALLYDAITGIKGTGTLDRVEQYLESDGSNPAKEGTEEQKAKIGRAHV